MIFRRALLCILLCSVTQCSINESNQESDIGNLVLVNVLHRHGDRTPTSSYPTDPYQNASFWPDGWGQLTNRGKQQTYMLGKWLRQRYGTFMPENYSKNYIYVQSTDVDRTLMSAESILAGLFPPKGHQKWNPHLSWQPIPIHTIPEKDDMVLASQHPCPRYNEEYQDLLHSEEMKKFNEKYAELYMYLSKHSGTLIHDAISLEYLYDTLHVEDVYNFTLPEWTQKVYPNEMIDIVDFSFSIQAFTKSMQLFKSGPLLKNIVSSMEEVINDVPDKRMMYVYSAHDTTVANLLMTLGVFNMRAPPYVATVVLELRRKGNEYNIIVLYHNSSDEPYVLTIPNCAPVCPYEQFIELTKSRIPENWTLQCKTSISFDFKLNTLSVIALILSGFLAMFLILSILFSVLYWKKKYLTSSYYYHHIHTEDQ